ncbi:cysteinyl-tRNA synthetase [Friedmanniella endophytica]|uniref:Cysteine--tRNA ligase n=2 Tax=Microlunatus kandeliicorticis TaxID=1759536 RepID=A0A7W3ITA5_9ACTN|nr:cysteine--tRNA ligase [Microlunatus kandeliicorticis]MBA8794837.1 cysteinyl-tRNA synthetase [Microlunatus kandeliicorticis]
MTFRLHDSMRQQVVDLDPVIPGQVSIYHCGLTVQSAPHVGHLRKEVVFDVLRRWLSHQGLRVTVIANVTDIDDKILTKSAEAGVPWYAHAYRYERELHAAYAALGCLPPTYEPRATGHIPEMLELIAILIERGHAYPATDGSGDVYFDVASWPDYGRLSHQRIEDMEPAPDADPRGKRDPRDFALWKGHKPGEPETASWPTPWGKGGRPGWHLECSAMAGKYLGDEFDIHGGGLDLRFPHHENELAQSTAAGRPFARVWMHNALVTAAGEKMSKSLGNGLLVSEVTRTYPPRAVRFSLLAPHYRSVIEFSDASMQEATTALERIDSFVARATELVGEVPSRPSDGFAAAMDDDLGTPAALADVYTAVRQGNAAIEAGDRATVADRLGAVRGALAVLGLAADAPAWAGGDQSGLTEVVDGLVGELLRQRQEARGRKDYAAADAIRDALGRLGVEIADTPSGPRWTVRPATAPTAGRS